MKYIEHIWIVQQTIGDSGTKNKNIKPIFNNETDFIWLHRSQPPVYFWAYNFIDHNIYITKSCVSLYVYFVYYIYDTN